MARKKTTTSKQKDYHKPKKFLFSDGSEGEERFVNDFGSKPVYQPTVPDPEAAKPPKDKAARMKYPPPKNNKVFRKQWSKFIRNVTSRESFKEAHLASLEILCDLYVEYDDLERIIRTEGRTYKRVSRHGETRAMHPAVAQLDKVRANIRQYTKQLDLFPKRDHGHEGDGEDEEWG